MPRSCSGPKRFPWQRLPRLSNPHTPILPSSPGAGSENFLFDTDHVSVMISCIPKTKATAAAPLKIVHCLEWSSDNSSLFPLLWPFFSSVATQHPLSGGPMNLSDYLHCHPSPFMATGTDRVRDNDGDDVPAESVAAMLNLLVSENQALRAKLRSSPCQTNPSQN